MLLQSISVGLLACSLAFSGASARDIGRFSDLSRRHIYRAEDMMNEQMENKLKSRQSSDFRFLNNQTKRQCTSTLSAVPFQGTRAGIDYYLQRIRSPLFPM